MNRAIGLAEKTRSQYGELKPAVTEVIKNNWQSEIQFKYIFAQFVNLGNTIDWLQYKMFL